MDHVATPGFALSAYRSHAQSTNLIAVWLPWRRVGVRRQVAETALQYWPIE
jgi:hypothetical protein